MVRAGCEQDAAPAAHRARDDERRHVQWIETNVGAKEGSTRRPGANRKFGARGDGVSYTAGTPDGAAAVGIECNPSDKDGVAVRTVAYSVESAKGRSMTAQQG